MDNTKKNQQWMTLLTRVMLGFVALSVLAFASVLLFGEPRPAKNGDDPSLQAPKAFPATATAPRQSGFGTGLDNDAFNEQFAKKLLAQIAADAERNKDQARKDTISAMDASEQRTSIQVAELKALLEEARASRAAPPGDTSDAIVVMRNKVGAPSSLVLGEPSPSPLVINPGRLSATNAAQLNPAQSRNPEKPTIPPFTILEASMLNGMVTTVGGDQPSTALARIEGSSVSANGFVGSLNGCHIAIEGRANLPAGRIEGKPVQMTCNLEDGAPVTWDIAGWVVDDDGMRGLRATIVNNNTKKIGLLALSEAVKSAGSAFQQQQQTNTTGANGTTSAFTGSVGRSVFGGALTGVGSGSGKAIEEYYSQFQPTLQTGGGRRVTIIIANELPLPYEGAYVSPLRQRAGTKSTGMIDNPLQ